MRNPQSKKFDQHHAIMAAIEHELRNPLAAITFSLDSLKQTETLSDSGLRMLDIASRQTQFAAQVLGTIADIFQLQRESDSSPWQPVDLNEVVAESSHSIAPALSSKRQRLHLKLAKSASISRGDPVRLQQAISNLLDNASKYTPPNGNIWIETSEAASQVTVVVRDSGIGVDPAIGGRIFDLFFSGSSSQEARTKSTFEAASPTDRVERSKSGLGIGLFLVQQIAIQHGGSIEVVTPESGDGSEFRLTLLQQ